MTGAGAVLILAVVLIVAALAWYLIWTIVALVKITKGLDETIAAVGEIVEKSAPVNDVVTTINAHLDAGVAALEGLLVKKAGMPDAVGLVEGLYPGAAAAGFRDFPESGQTKAPRIAEVYTRGVLTLARLGREAPIAAASPDGPVLRDAERGRQRGDESLPRHPAHAAGEAAPLAGHRRRRAGAVRAERRTRSAQAHAGAGRGARSRREARCRHRHRLTTSARPASRARSRRWRGWARRLGSSRVGTACCR